MSTSKGKSMSGVIRVVKSRNFTTINNEFVSCEHISWGARGILTYLLTRPDDWRVITSDLVAKSPQGKAAIKVMLNELETYGYLTRKTIKEDDGKFAWVTTVYEQPVDFEHRTKPEDRQRKVKNEPKSGV